MLENNNNTVCGLICGECDHFSENCTGCNPVCGRPFWLEFVNAEICPIYDCCVNKKGYEHCGHCSEFICEKFTRFRDPNTSDEEQEEMLKKMKENILARK